MFKTRYSLVFFSGKGRRKEILMAPERLFLLIVKNIANSKIHFDLVKKQLRGCLCAKENKIIINHWIESITLRWHRNIVHGTCNLTHQLNDDKRKFILSLTILIQFICESEFIAQFEKSHIFHARSHTPRARISFQFCCSQTYIYS